LGAGRSALFSGDIPEQKLSRQIRGIGSSFIQDDFQALASSSAEREQMGHFLRLRIQQAVFTFGN